MRRLSKVDRNQPEIVQDLRTYGASVVSLAAIHGGVPDLLVGYRGVNLLMEVKDGELPESKRRLTPKQQEFFVQWGGQRVTVLNSVDAIAELMAIDQLRDYHGAYDTKPFAGRT